MKRFTRTLVSAMLGVMLVASVVAVGIGAASDGTTNAQSSQYGPPGDQYGKGGNDRVMGTGHRLNLAGQPTRVHVNAKSGPAGENASGDFWVSVETADLGTVSLRGRIHCLTVDGNHAAARGTVERSTAPPVPVGTDYQIQVTDNKSSGFPDTNINFFGFDPGDTDCPIIPFDEVPLTNGNFVVHDRS